ncbi:MAG: rRNA methyltransferase [Desulfobacterales bacterium]|nr:MAG: rRNA methyltransferase [Desulfobacterales bacterium]
MRTESKQTDPRALAFELIESGQKKKATLDRSIEAASALIESLSAKDRALCNALVFGVLRHRGRLDHIIQACSHRPIDRIDPIILTLLRLGVFQLVCLDRIPDFAAIHATMELSKKKVGRKAAGFINAVLRKTATEHSTLALPDKRKKFTTWLTATCSIPPWLGKRWVSTFGRENAEKIGRATLGIPPITLRINHLNVSRDAMLNALDQEKIFADVTHYSDSGINITAIGRPVSCLPGFDQGWFQVQDEAAQLVTTLLDPRPGERILDACAGLGTKTCHMGQLMKNKGDLVANDPDVEKQKGLIAEAQRLGLTLIKTVSFDITKARLEDMGGYFQRILVDAPCTGLGVMRRNPDIRWKRRKNDIQRMAALQKKVLNAAANFVAPGGVLVYAVCSCEPEENEGVMDHFLKKRKDFTADPDEFQRLLPWFSAPETQQFSFKTYPNHTGMDGFFTARLKRMPTPEC